VLLLRKRLRGINGAALSVSLFKVTTAAAVMAIATVGIEYGAHVIVASDGVGAQVFRLGLAIGGGLATLAACANLLKIREFDDVMKLLRSRVSGGPK